MDEWPATPTDPQGWDQHAPAVIGAIKDLPTTRDAAMAAIMVVRDAIMEDTPEDVRDRQAWLAWVKAKFKEVQEVRELAEKVFLQGELNIAKRLVQQPVASGGEHYHQQPTVDPEATVGRVATVTELLGRDKKYGWRLRQIAPLNPEGLDSCADELHRAGKEATLTGIVQLLRMNERTDRAAWRRLDSMTAPRIQSGMDLRIGDCRKVLSDIADNSVALLLTDPPYGNDAEVLYDYVAKLAARVLVPGGSLICYTGTATLPRVLQILMQKPDDDTAPYLTYQWCGAMMHGAGQRLFGAGVISMWKPIIWLVKGRRRDAKLVADVVRSQADKSKLAWAQGDGGVSHWIHLLTDPEEVILDPFAGTAEWGRIAVEMGRRWIGADVAPGGDTTVVA
jgi:hypothetical protein